MQLCPKCSGPALAYLGLRSRTNRVEQRRNEPFEGQHFEAEAGSGAPWSKGVNTPQGRNLVFLVGSDDTRCSPRTPIRESLSRRKASPTSSGLRRWPLGCVRIRRTQPPVIDKQKGSQCTRDGIACEVLHRIDAGRLRTLGVST